MFDELFVDQFLHLYVSVTCARVDGKDHRLQMHIHDDDRAVLLSNFEVFQHLNERKTRAAQSISPRTKKPQRRPENVNTIELESLNYLTQESMCSTYTSSNVSDVLNALNAEGRINLTRAEKLQIINLRPRSEVVLYSMVEDIDCRVMDAMGNQDTEQSEAVIETLIQVVTEHLVNDEDAVEEAADDDDDDTMGVDHNEVPKVNNDDAMEEDNDLVHEAKEKTVPEYDE